MNPDIKRHIKVWAGATVTAYAFCVLLFLMRWEVEQTILSRPFFFLTEKLIATVMGVSLLTGIIIYMEVVAQTPFLKVIKDDAVAVALFTIGVLYCMAWIWTYS
jgi:hypothetical protein